MVLSYWKSDLVHSLTSDQTPVPSSVSSVSLKYAAASLLFMESMIFHIMANINYIGCAYMDKLS